MKAYTELEVWTEVRKLTNMVYLISKSFPKEETSKRFYKLL